MKIVISDYPDSMMPTHDYEREILLKGLGQCEVIIHEYSDGNREKFLKLMEDADALLTAFIQLDEDFFKRAKKLKIISNNATGYDNVDLEIAKRYNVAVCPVGEYATVDVAEFTIALLVSLVKNLKQYEKDIDVNHLWRYDAAKPNKRLSEMTLGIFGFGKIGKKVAQLAHSLGMKVLVCDIIDYSSEADEMGVKQVSKEEILVQSDIISNHMNLNPTNINFFDYELFERMKKNPYFINMGRGGSIVEEDLIMALDKELLKGAGLDLLSDETPDLANHPLVGRTNVLITPHVAFYSSTSIKELQRISTENLVYYLTNQKEKVFKLVTDF
ncbi:NAD(P)-dependent oxidoreductase [Streptococcus thoraltensis]|uniref:NAD(P)-dependent oxidoreductase n=1 Tax=Streptococcus thoraltensis TaxID=55085 RepID=UPI00036EC98A|nr:NAD(P)-dependent oxidoreductase [Streptococcus thoraltensis]MDY4761527.1 NAD(P)-dependent oxidoreductase [Streptococcus thoraltensis]